MSEPVLTFRLPLNHPDGEYLFFVGAPDDSAAGVIYRADAPDRPPLYLPDDAGQGGYSGISLLPARDDDGPLSATGINVFQVPWGTTLRELRLLIGPDDDAVRLQIGGFGGDGAEAFILWLLEDLLPFGGELLSVYGGVELGVRASRALRKRNHRETRELVQEWLHAGDRELPDALREVITDRSYWPMRDVDLVFGISGPDLRRAMESCGYGYSPSDSAYHAPQPLDAVT